MKVNIFANKNKKSSQVKKALLKVLEKYHFELNADDFELAIAIGGDGSFIRMIKACDYDSSKLYIGINCGTLGFLQNINPEDIDKLIRSISKNKYKVEEVSLQETTVETKSEEFKFLSLNEVLFREKNLNTVNFKIHVDSNYLENYVGDGLLISSSVGSTAYNLSFGGSMVYNTLHTMQITPVAPLVNSAYKNLLNSLIIPENLEIKLTPQKNKKAILLSIDGENITVDDIKEIIIKISKSKIKCLRLNDYHFISTIKDKFLK